ncbi:MAG: hypothetical protein H7Y88_12460 [Phycisphaerales bacterium]|nr:hypothetical protein [Phycisphaerales bacterium]
MRAAKHLAILLLVCLPLYFWGLTTHGLTNWQEAQRAVVAREMHTRILAGEPGAWWVPTINGQPYIAKPPLIYWCQIALANLGLGDDAARVDVFELRLTVALAGLLGVLATYFVARSLLREPRARDARDDAPATDHTPWDDDASLWAALALATGVLYVRSSRIGELDILLVPTVVTAVGAIWIAWRRFLDHGRAHFGAVGIAVTAATLAALAKGPPAIMVIALAGYGGIAGWHAATNRPTRAGLVGTGGELGTPRDPSKWTVRAVWFVVLNIIIAVGWISRSLHPGGSIVGTLLFPPMIGWVALPLLVLLTSPWRARSCLASFARTHPIAVLGIPLAALWAWGRIVSSYIGPARAADLAGDEAENLVLLFPEAPLNNLEAAAYGVGLGSVAAILAIIWLVKDKPKFDWTNGVRHGQALAIIGAWVGLGLIAFSVLGKGVPRYLTPVWPGIAILGGVFLGVWLRDCGTKRAGKLAAAGPANAEARPAMVPRTILALIVAALCAGQAWWYAVGREDKYGSRSPRAIVGELLRRGITPDQLATFEFRTPAVDYYAGKGVQPVSDARQRIGISGMTEWTVADLVTHLQSPDPATPGTPCEMVLLVRESQPVELDPALPIDRLRAAGLAVEPIEGLPEFEIDSGRVCVTAVRVRGQ